MSFRVRLSPRAQEDIERNARWWADNHSVEQAIRWFNAVHKQLGTLRTFPESHGLSLENGEFPYEIRDKLVGLGSRPGYRAVFTIMDDTVHVLTVRSSSEDRLRADELTIE
ncbi:type II toxin-antitoxin system RelE/ParE family toxin [Candidatus Peribacteria bacterium]|nr:type II toxin-antitoxin system RelE/ParE family toxin [Planctomycetales bacterium]MCB9807824.1 type II toxin-antitoxin system RelE/ParE family toxin [Candidatus Peribacteria bacterium]MCB9924559.1 type II toxin-antitoxin system RelE/ParE family toxin [Planctomycetaceae bacterium]